MYRIQEKITMQIRKYEPSLSCRKQIEKDKEF